MSAAADKYKIAACSTLSKMGGKGWNDDKEGTNSEQSRMRVVLPSKQKLCENLMSKLRNVEITKSRNYKKPKLQKKRCPKKVSIRFLSKKKINALSPPETKIISTNQPQDSLPTTLEN
jgi:hypothetical protein